MPKESSVAGTAGWIAAARARETARPDRLFEDPWAAALAGEAGWARLRASERVGGENVFLPVRTRFFDDVVVDGTSWARQLVLLGAGFDTRAYRLDLPATLDVYELDLPAVLAHKQSVLDAAHASPTCRRHVVDVDLRDDWPDALLAAGFDPRLPTVWLAEGLVFYLDPESVDRLVAHAASLSTTRAQLALDVFGTGLLRLPAMQPVIQQRLAAGRAAPFCTDDPSGLMIRGGWRRCVITAPGQSAANYGRLPLTPDGWTGGADPGMRTHLVLASGE